MFRKAKRRTLQLNAQLAQTLTEKGVEASSDETTTALVGKVAEISGGGTEEIENLIDESEVLEGTEGTVTEKVEQLIDKAGCEQRIQESLYNLPLNEPHTLFKRTSVKDVSKFDFSKVGNFNYMFFYAKI